MMTSYFRSCLFILLLTAPAFAAQSGENPAASPSPQVSSTSSASAPSHVVQVPSPRPGDSAEAETDVPPVHRWLWGQPGFRNELIRTCGPLASQFIFNLGCGASCSQACWGAGGSGINGAIASGGTTAALGSLGVAVGSVVCMYLLDKILPRENCRWGDTENNDHHLHPASHEEPGSAHPLVTPPQAPGSTLSLPPAAVAGQSHSTSIEVERLSDHISERNSKGSQGDSTEKRDPVTNGHEKQKSTSSEIAR